MDFRHKNNITPEDPLIIYNYINGLMERLTMTQLYPTLMKPKVNLMMKKKTMLMMMKAILLYLQWIYRDPLIIYNYINGSALYQPNLAFKTLDKR